LKVATFRDCNDPFELSVFYSKDNVQQKRLDHFIADTAKDFGIVCFSDDWLDPVYWSHYADRHRGIALGFDVADGYAMPVRYSNKRIEFPNFPGDPDVDIFLSTKFENWKYERERRIICRLSDAIVDGGLLFEPFGPQVILREVILGHLCTETADTVRALVDSRHSGVITYKAKLAQKFFSVVPDELTVP